jgi:tetratricopeptide (TPR) repeat protein
MLAGSLTLLAAVALGGTPDPGVRADASVTQTRVMPAARGGGPADVSALQERLRRLPDDHRSWSALALAYVERARVTGDPTLYGKAEQAVLRAGELAPDDALALTAQASLAAARHEFRASLAAADRAISVNPYSAAAHALRSDALTELGRYDAAHAAAIRADDLEPGPATYARLSYAAELGGDLAEAARLMELSRDAAGASAPAYAFASFHLGELARAVGDLRAARRHYARALEADATYAPALAGRARVAVAHGRTEAAIRDYRAVVARQPLPEYVVELGELYLVLGREKDAAAQFAVAQAVATLATDNGVGTDLEAALFEADHGSPDAALAAARTEWRARQSIHTADALGWALHALGRDDEALRFARLANRLGTRDARLLFHLGAIEAAVGRAGAARGHLRDALAIDNGVAPWRERQARALLDSLRAGTR